MKFAKFQNDAYRKQMKTIFLSILGILLSINTLAGSIYMPHIKTLINTVKLNFELAR